MELYVTALEAVHDVKSFNCNKPALSAWLQHISRQHQKNGMSKTYVLANEEDPAQIIGFYALAMRGMVPITVLPSEMARRLPCEIPAYTLARLAVAADKQGQGFGADLLMNAMERVRVAADAVGGYALFVDAKDEAAAAFYGKFGFVPCPSNPLLLVMMISELPKG